MIGDMPYDLRISLDKIEKRLDGLESLHRTLLITLQDILSEEDDEEDNEDA